MKTIHIIQIIVLLFAIVVAAIWIGDAATESKNHIIEIPQGCEFQLTITKGGIQK